AAAAVDAQLALGNKVLRVALDRDDINGFRLVGMRRGVGDRFDGLKRSPIPTAFPRNDARTGTSSAMPAVEPCPLCGPCSIPQPAACSPGMSSCFLQLCLS